MTELSCKATSTRNISVVVFIFFGFLTVGCSNENERRRWNIEYGLDDGWNETYDEKPYYQPEHGLELDEQELAELQKRQSLLSNAWEEIRKKASESDSSFDLMAVRNGTNLKSESIGEVPILDWEKLMGPMWENTIGYAWEGRHGELIHSDSAKAPIHIVEVSNGLELIRFDVRGFPYIHAVVRSGNELILNPLTNRNRNTSLSPRFFRTEEQSPNISELSRESPILYSGSANPPRLTRGGVLKGWMFPTREGNLICASFSSSLIMVSSIEDCLWVEISKDGFDLVHSGPEYTGLYAKVSLDGKIKFITPFEDARNSNWKDGIWPWLNSDGNISFDSSEVDLKVLDARLNVLNEY